MPSVEQRNRAILEVAKDANNTLGEAFKDNLKPGVRENELVGIMHKVAYDLGAEVFSGIFCTSGEFNWPNPRETCANRIIRPGDIVYADVYNTSYNGYKTCYYRTFCCGAIFSLNMRTKRLEATGCTVSGLHSMNFLWRGAKHPLTIPYHWRKG